MKKSIIIAVLAISSFGTYAQSTSYKALLAKFKGKEDVHAFKVSGFICRAILSFSNSSDNEVLKQMTKDIRQVRLIVIPTAEFERQNLSLTSFRNYLKKDSFNELMMVKDQGDKVWIYQREDDGKNSRYFLLVEEPTEVVAVEMIGEVDPSIFKNGDNKITTTSR